jgi:hypothetical protein
MRVGLLILGIVVCIGLLQGWFARACEHATTAALSEEARVAIEVRCRDQSGRAAHECRSLLKKLYLARSLDPDTTLRTYCDSFRTARWGGSRPQPPAVCVQRYGGWKDG